MLAISSAGAKVALRLFCHFTTKPVLPVRVRSCGWVLLQMVCAADTVPPTEEGTTVVVMELLVTLVGLAQMAVGVMITLMASPLAKVVVVYVALVAPAISTPFFCHW